MQLHLNGVSYFSNIGEVMTNTQKAAMQQALDALNVGITKMNALGCAIECMPLHYANKALRAALAEPTVEPAFYGFMDEEECCVHLCFTPHCAGGKNNTLPTAYYTSPQPPPAEVPLLLNVCPFCEAGKTYSIQKCRACGSESVPGWLHDQNAEIK